MVSKAESAHPAASTSSKAVKPSDFDYDLVVIGSGPSGQRAAIQAAKIGKRAAVIERARAVGGVCVNTGTIPSKTFREAVMHLSGFRERGIYGSSYRVKQDISIDDLLYRVQQVVRSEIDVIRNQMTRNRVELIESTARFVDPHTTAGDRSRPPRSSLPAVPRPPAITIFPLTGSACSPATMCSGWSFCHARSSWSAPASSASNTPRCLQPWACA
jgi:hypothetical protein